MGLRGLLICVLLLGSVLVAEAAPKRVVGVCAGSWDCKVCRDCSQCAYCSPKNPKGGSCGVLRAQDAATARKRILLQQRAAGKPPLAH